MVAKTPKNLTHGKPGRAKVKYPAFAARLRAAAEKAGLQQKDMVEALGVNKETLRLYFKGERMPDDERMKIIAMLIGRSAAHLRFGEKDTAAQPPREVVTDEDEMTLLASYRRLPTYGKKALRARAAELLENFAPPDRDNPYGKKVRNDGTQ